VTYYIEVQVRKERETLLVAAARKASRYSRSAICLHSTKHKAAQPNRHHRFIQSPPTTRWVPEVRGAASFARAAGGFSCRCPPWPPRVYSARRRFLAPAHSSQLTAHVEPGLCVCVWCFCRLPACAACAAAAAASTPETTIHVHRHWPLAAARSSQLASGSQSPEPTCQLTTGKWQGCGK
jgi:hypothetical protein